MWKRFSKNLRCVRCGSQLQLSSISEKKTEIENKFFDKANQLGIPSEDFNVYIETGVLLCGHCKALYPIHHGLPVMLPYKTDLHFDFINEFSEKISSVAKGYDFLNEQPARGEEYVLKTFSKEWFDYSYDNVLWTWTYQERENIFLAETGLNPGAKLNTFVEIGCGLGVVTSFAEKNFGADAVGVDLSLASMKAAGHFKNNPFLHFVQASLWKLPFAKNSFDMVYSHGVIHHTNSTEKAFYKISDLCKPGGRCYLWIYGKGSIDENIFRKVAYAFEYLTRPVFARLPSGLNAILLSPFAIIYIFINMLQRASGETRQPYNYERAMHAVRDRLTPLFAFRTGMKETKDWFAKSGFKNLEELDISRIPKGIQCTFRRNVGVRGIKKTSSEEKE